MQFDSRYLKLLIYGPFGSGKTTLAASSVYVPEMKDVIYISVEGGELSLSEFPDDLVDNNITVRNFRQVARVFEFLRAHCRYRDSGDDAKLIEQESRLRGEEVKIPRKYRTVVIDTLSEVAVYMTHQILGMNLETMPLDEEPAPSDIRDWGKLLGMERNFVRSIRDLPMHVVMVCPEIQIEVGTKDNKRTLIRPAFQGRFIQEVAGFFDVVGYLRTATNPDASKGELRRLDLQRGIAYDPKNRIQAIKVPFINNPTMADLVVPLYKAHGG